MFCFGGGEAFELATALSMDTMDTIDYRDIYTISCLLASWRGFRKSTEPGESPEFGAELGSRFAWPNG